MQAKDTIAIDYYLKGQDAEEKQSELTATRRRGTQQLEHYMQETNACRGNMIT